MAEAGIELRAFRIQEPDPRDKKVGTRRWGGEREGRARGGREGRGETRPSSEETNKSKRMAEHSKVAADLHVRII